MNLLSVPITKAGWLNIELEVERRGGARLNHKTMMAGQRNNRHAFAGVAGEMAVRALFPFFTPCDGNRDYDILSKTGKKIDVKTRSASVPPQPHFDVRVPEYSFKNQKCDILLFCHAVWDGSVITEVFVTGWLPKEEFAKIAHRSDVSRSEKQASGFDQKDGGENMMFARVEQLRPAKGLENL